MFAQDGKNGRIRPHVITDAPHAGEHLGEQLEPLLIESAGHDEAVLFIFPDLRTEEQVVSIINGLCAHASWEAKEIQWQEYPRSDILVALSWKSPEQFQSTTLGLAPFGTMPVMRRAPLVAIALWPGGHQNLHWPYRGKRVSLADMPHSLDAETHQKMKVDSEQRKAEYLLGQNEGAARHQVSFCFSQAARIWLRQ
jgi:hypothetical protein